MNMQILLSLSDEDLIKESIAIWKGNYILGKDLQEEWNIVEKELNRRGYIFDDNTHKFIKSNGE